MQATSPAETEQTRASGGNVSPLGPPTGCPWVPSPVVVWIRLSGVGLVGEESEPPSGGTAARAGPRSRISSIGRGSRVVQGEEGRILHANPGGPGHGGEENASPGPPGFGDGAGIARMRWVLPSIVATGK